MPNLVSQLHKMQARKAAAAAAQQGVLKRCGTVCTGGGGKEARSHALSRGSKVKYSTCAPHDAWQS